ncbi:MAG: radical SAM protein [Eggerthellaceae bacterium]|nr:radical SAM protein [Eggerthellaceae bacterium]
MLKKLRFIEAGAANRYHKTWKNHFLYNASICNPSTGLATLTTIAKRLVDDTLMYSESIGEIRWNDIWDADIVFISINTFNAVRGYEIADKIRGFLGTVEDRSRPLVVLGGMHATLNYPEAVHHADYVLLGDGDESIVEFIEAVQSLSGEPEAGRVASASPIKHDPAFQQGICAAGETDGHPSNETASQATSQTTDRVAFPLYFNGAWPRKGAQIQIPGLAFLRLADDGTTEAATTAARPQPTDIETIPDRSLVYGYARMAKSYDTLWPQVHASRGCTGTCDYCCVIAHFGRVVRTRTPEVVVEDIRQAIAFHSRSFPPRLNRAVWLTDDNFALDREWAKSVLRAIIASDITWPITVQARWELGFDDEMLDLMAQANFFEVSLGIEFIDDASFALYHKRCTRERIEAAIANIHAHGIGVRGLFILGSDEDTPGVGERLGRFIIDNDIHGSLIQSMFFVPRTPVYERNKGNLLHDDWNLFNGNVVHRPKNMTPAELQQEMINASHKTYSLRRLAHSLVHAKGIFKVLAIGETVWQAHLRREWRKQLVPLRAYDLQEHSSQEEREAVLLASPLQQETATLKIAV